MPTTSKTEPRLQLNIRLTPEMKSLLESLKPRVEAIHRVGYSVAQLVALALAALDRETTATERKAQRNQAS